MNNRPLIQSLVETASKFSVNLKASIYTEKGLPPSSLQVNPSLILSLYKKVEFNQDNENITKSHVEFYLSHYSKVISFINCCWS